MDSHEVTIRRNPKYIGTNRYIAVCVDGTPVISFAERKTLDGFAQALLAAIEAQPTE